MIDNADGFPRTALQVDFLKLLYDKMLELHNKHADGPEEWQYPRPSFKVCQCCLCCQHDCSWFKAVALSPHTVVQRPLAGIQPP